MKKKRFAYYLDNPDLFIKVIMWTYRIFVFPAIFLVACYNAITLNYTVLLIYIPATIWQLWVYNDLVKQHRENVTRFDDELSLLIKEENDRKEEI